VAGGPQARLPQPRFFKVDTYECHDISWQEHTFKHSIQKADTRAQLDFTSRTEEDRPGWLSFLGLGVTEDKTVKTTVTHVSLTEVREGEEVSLTVHLEAQAGEHYAVEAYYDRVFGTFAFRKGSLGSEVISGTARDSAGRPLPRQLVTLTGGTKGSRPARTGKGVIRSGPRRSTPAASPWRSARYPRRSISGARPSATSRCALRDNACHHRR
jgi:hypothetical protein